MRRVIDTSSDEFSEGEDENLRVEPMSGEKTANETTTGDESRKDGNRRFEQTETRVAHARQRRWVTKMTVVLITLIDRK